MLKRCIVLYAQDALAFHSDVKVASSCEDPQPSRESNCEALRSVSKAGASGLLVWRKSQTNKAYPSELEQVGQILGQHEWHEGREWYSSLEKDFNRAKCCLLSNSDATLQTFKQAFSRTESWVHGVQGAASPASQIQTSLGNAIEEDFDLIFIHALFRNLLKEAEAGQSNQPKDPLVALDDVVKMLVEQYVDETTMLVLLLGDGQSQQDHGIVLENRGREVNGQGALNNASACARLPYLPKQSYQFSNGELIEDWCDTGFVLSIHYSPVNHIRKDLVEQPSITEAYRKGGNGISLASHFLKSVMYNLLKAPKYGA